jgi:CheY-like chemotaxis protein
VDVRGDVDHSRARGFRQQTILLVRADDAVRRLAASILQRAGYTVVVARNGAEALVIGERVVGRIDLLLVDAELPRGPDLVARLAPKRPAMKVIYLAGAEPLHADELVRRVRDALR